MDEQNKLAKIDLFRILRLMRRQLRRYWWSCLLLVVLFAGLLGYRAYRSYVPQYQAVATYAASSGVSGVTDVTTTTSYYDTQARAQIVSAFPYLYASEAMQERLKEELGVTSVSGTVTASAVGETSFYKLTAVGSDREMTLALLEAVEKNYPEVASFVVGDAVIEVIEEARVTSQPVNALSVRNSVYRGILLGICASIALLFLMALGHKTVETAQDLQGQVKLSCLGVIPRIDVKKRRRNSGNLVSLLNPNVREALEPSVGSVRVQLMRQAKKVNPQGKVLVVTSTYAGEGKTTVSINLAISLAKSGKSVILVDADLRNQNVKSRFGIETETLGLLELVESGDSNLAHYLVQIDDMPLYLLAGDQQRTSPMEQLESIRMAQALDQLRTLADVVILDAPPAGLLADAAVLCARADYALYVVRYDGPPVYQVADSIGELQKQKVNLLGYVINGAAQTGQSGYGRYGKYGSYGSYSRYGEQ